jgi:hypothetical protein
MVTQLSPVVEVAATPAVGTETQWYLGPTSYILQC